jgi:hypothetical protein
LPQIPPEYILPHRISGTFSTRLGGGGSSSIGTLRPTSEVIDNNTNGVLKFTLHPTSYEWEFIPIAGQTFTDAGSDSCVILSTDNDPPTMFNNTGSTVQEGGTDPIPNTELQYDDAQSASSIAYSVTSGPTNGRSMMMPNRRAVLLTRSPAVQPTDNLSSPVSLQPASPRRISTAVC